LTIKQNKAGRRLFFGGEMRANEAIVSAAGAYLNKRDMPDRVMEWARRAIRESGYDEKRLRADVLRIVSEVNRKVK
jgi:hypothetical protein